MAIETILSNDLAVNLIYPFLLVFVLIFAILQKSKILGEGKQQIDALVALSIALIVAAFSWATNIITMLMPFLAVSVVSILVFLLIYGFVAADNKEGLKIPNWVKWAAFVLALIIVIVALIVATGQWNNVYGYLFGGSGKESIWANILMVVVIIGALLAVILSGKGKGSKSDSG